MTSLPGMDRGRTIRTRLVAIACSSLAWVSCASSSEERESTAGEAQPASAGGVRQLEELPERHRELWQAWLTGEEDWSARREEALADPELTRFLVDNLARELIRAYRASEFTLPDSPSIGRFERTRAELIVLGEQSAGVLAEIMAIAASDIGDVVAGVLADIGRPAILPVAEQLERADLDQARMRAALLLGRLPHALGDEPAVRAALARHLASDPHWLVRVKCAETLGRRGYNDVETRSTRLALEAALSDPDGAVRIAASGALAYLRDPAAVPALTAYYERSIDAAEIDGMRAATESLKFLTGSKEGLDARGWRDWWRDHRGGSGRQP